MLDLRCDRMATIQKIVAGLTEESLDEETAPVQAPGWPESGSYRLRNLLRYVLREEWEHHLFAERDLGALARPHAPSQGWRSQIPGLPQ